MTLGHLDQTLYMLGYLPKEDRVFLYDKGMNIYSYRVLLSVLQYQTAVVRNDFNTANDILPQIPNSEYNNVARFLESQVNHYSKGFSIMTYQSGLQKGSLGGIQ